MELADPAWHAWVSCMVLTLRSLRWVMRRSGSHAQAADRIVDCMAVNKGCSPPDDWARELAMSEVLPDANACERAWEAAGVDVPLGAAAGEEVAPGAGREADEGAEDVA